MSSWIKLRQVVLSHVKCHQGVSRSSCYTKICQILSSFIKFCHVLSSFVRFCQVFSSFVKFCQVLSSFVKFCQVESYEVIGSHGKASGAMGMIGEVKRVTGSHREKIEAKCEFVSCVKLC